MIASMTVRIESPSMSPATPDNVAAITATIYHRHPPCHIQISPDSPSSRCVRVERIGRVGGCEIPGRTTPYTGGR
jgi:hypothetical protein